MDHTSKGFPSTNQDQHPPPNWVEVRVDRMKRHVGFTTAGILFTLIVTLGAFTDALDWTMTWGLDRCRDIGVCDPPPPMWLVGNLTEVRLGAANVPQAMAWSERSLATPTSLSPAGAAWPGRFVTYRVEFRGLVGSECFVRWTLLDAFTGERVTAGLPTVDGTNTFKTVHAKAYPDSRWKVEANQQDVAIGTLWVPYLVPGSFVVEVELLDPDGAYLDIERTPAFPVTADDLPG